MTDRDAAAMARRAGAVAWLCAAASASTWSVHLPAGVLASPAGWVWGLASHWQWLYLVLGLAALVIVLATALLTARATARRPQPRWRAGRALPMAVVPAVVLVAAWLHHSPGADGPWPADRTGQTPPRRVQLASANLNLQTTDHRALRAWLLSDGAPDVMALQEFTPSALAMVNAADVQAAYPHRLLEPRVDPFGLAVLSKHRLQSAQPVQPSDPRATLVLRLVLDVQGQHLAVSAVHPMPPLDAAYAQARDASLRAEARHLQATGLPGVLVGDLNDTPWSTGLRAALPLRRATGLAPTWPQAWGWLSLLPLDHVLVTPQLQVLNHGLGPDIGSDHRPVWVQLAL